MATLKGHFEDSNGNYLFPILSGATTTIEPGSRSSQSYTSGAYLYFGDKLCKTTTAIPQNTVLAIGTNLLEVTIGGEMTAHFKASDDTEFSFQTLVDGGYN